MKKFLPSIFYLFLIAMTAPAIATTMVALTQEDLIERADLVVQGRILDVRSFWNKEKTAILTEARVQVEDALVGKPGPVIAVRTIGGQVGDVRIVFEGGPELKAGDRQLLFLKRHPDGAMRVLGARQGQYRIRSNQQGIEMMIPLIETGPPLKTLEGEEVARPQAMPAAQLKNRIRETARRIGRPIEQ